MDRGVAAVLRQAERQGPPLLRSVTAALLAAACLAAVAGGAKPAEATVLAAHVKKSMQASYRSVRGLTFTAVTCSIRPHATRGRCTASFRLPKRKLKGVFAVRVTVNRKTGGVRWRATSARCTDTRTHKRVSC